MSARYTHMLRLCIPRYDSFTYIMEDRKHIAQLILKYLNGTLSQAEKQELDTWKAASPVNLGIFENVNTPEKLLQELEVQGKVAEIAHAAGTRIDQAITDPQPVKLTKSVRFRPLWYAAAIVVIGLFIWLYTQSPPANNHRTGSQGALITTTTLTGQYDTVSLSDHSVVYLDGDSRMQAPETFPATERRVALEGGALFSVEPLYKNGKKIPFIVAIKEGDLAVGQVEVLGTRFNIDAYRNRQYYKATVFEGEIKVSNSSDSKTLMTNQVARWTKNGPIVVTDITGSQGAVPVKDTTLEYVNTHVKLVYEALENVFDVTTEYKNNIIPEQQFTGELYTPLGIQTLIKVINKECKLKAVYDSAQKKIIVQ